MGVQVYYPESLSRQPAYRDHAGVLRLPSCWVDPADGYAEIRVADEIGSRILSLPLFYGITEEQIETVCYGVLAGLESKLDP